MDNLFPLFLLWIAVCGIGYIGGAVLFWAKHPKDFKPFIKALIREVKARYGS